MIFKMTDNLGMVAVIMSLSELTLHSERRHVYLLLLKFLASLSLSRVTSFVKRDIAGTRWI